METHEKRALIEYYLDAYNSFDVKRMVTAFHPDIEFKNFSGGKVSAIASGIEQFRVLAEKSEKMFSSRQQSIKAFEATGDQASIEIEYAGVLAVDLPNGMKAGETLQLTGHSDFIFQDQKIYRLTDYSG